MAVTPHVTKQFCKAQAAVWKNVQQSEGPDKRAGSKRDSNSGAESLSNGASDKIKNVYPSATF